MYCVSKDSEDNVGLSKIEKTLMVKQIWEVITNMIPVNLAHNIMYANDVYT
jgi:hypothetical protein